VIFFIFLNNNGADREADIIENKIDSKHGMGALGMGLGSGLSR